ncbi:MAG: flagellar basal body L-ring protein FlgH [Spirochaetes bacterium]|nr:flagellar basal body L-ring protein FlgH [Spirochaetota bacterium]
MKLPLKWTAITILTFLYSISILFAETLWDNKAGDIYSRNINYKTGDTIKILIEEETAILYKSSTQSLKTYTLDVKGGDFSAVLNFLPQGKVEENKNSQDKDEIKISNFINAQIVNVDNSLLTIEGSKTITLNNKTSTVRLNGRIHINDIINQQVYARDILDQRLTITTLLENQSSIIADNDIISVITNPDSTTDQKEELQLSEIKKRELMLQYVNKILNLIF